jgi:hypothetical protein
MPPGFGLKKKWMKKKDCAKKKKITIGLKGPILFSIALVAWAGCSNLRGNS